MLMFVQIISQRLILFSNLSTCTSRDISTECILYSASITPLYSIMRVDCCLSSQATSSQTLNIPIPTSFLTVLLDYLYEDDSPRLRQSHDPEFVCSVLAVADQFLLTRLKEICEKALSSLLTLKNAAALLEFAYRCNATNLKMTVMQFICLNLSAMLENG